MDTEQEKKEKELRYIFEEHPAWGILCAALSGILCYFWIINSLIPEIFTLPILGGILSSFVLVYFLPSNRSNLVKGTTKFVKPVFTWTKGIDVAVGHSICFTLLWFVFRNGFLDIYPAQIVATFALLTYILVVPVPLILSRSSQVPFFKTTASIDTTTEV